jgi:hypothetical protein
MLLSYPFDIICRPRTERSGRKKMRRKKKRRMRRGSYADIIVQAGSAGRAPGRRVAVRQRRTSCCIRSTSRQPR